jgi:N-hydroxyarylamine O-acetyltransferase
LDVEALCRRVGYAGPREPSVDALRALHRAFVRAVPFENLDIHLGRPIVLDEEAFFEKVVRRGRGGFCYELNGLFARALEELGFRVTRLGAQVIHEGVAGPERAHLILLVELERRWLVDVGHGDWVHQPLELDAEGAQVDPAGTFRVVRDGDLVQTERLQPDGGWLPRQRFTLEPRVLPDFESMCRFHQCAPESFFRQHRMCTRPARDGRDTLFDSALIEVRQGRQQVTPLTSAAEVRICLAEHFGIQL